MNPEAMNRRKALRALALGGIGAATAPAWVDRLTEVALALGGQGASRTAPTAAWTPAVLTPHQNETVVTLSELIIPQTDTAGAKAAGVNQFIDTVLADAAAADREQFLQGLDWVDARSKDLYSATFIGATRQQQTDLLTSLSAPANGTVVDQVGVEFFRGLKALTITGYYTSRIGRREELGDQGRVVFPDYLGCTHREHQGEAAGSRRN